MIHFRCPQCASRLRVDETKAGQEAKCPKCESLLRIPDQASSVPARPDDGQLDDFRRAAAPASTRRGAAENTGSGARTRLGPLPAHRPNPLGNAKRGLVAAGVFFVLALVFLSQSRAPQPTEIMGGRVSGSPDQKGARIAVPLAMFLVAGALLIRSMLPWMTLLRGILTAAGGFCLTPSVTVIYLYGPPKNIAAFIGSILPALLLLPLGFRMSTPRSVRRRLRERRE